MAKLLASRRRSTCQTRKLRKTRRSEMNIVRRGPRGVPPSGELRALSLVAPELAGAILAKQKKVENRTWAPPSTCGPGSWLALHVSTTEHGSKVKWCREHVRQAWDACGASKLRNPGRPGAPKLPNAAIVGLIRIAGHHRTTREEKQKNPWALGPICWEIDRAVRLNPPITGVAGDLGCWRVEHKLTTYGVRRLRARLQEAVQSTQLGYRAPSTYPRVRRRLRGLFSVKSLSRRISLKVKKGRR
eukprot:gnl/TRDRNA2_/TRDRNA2_48802_c0_seq1.p1 gnl/TRDRNA2_/TRDRNA2_48802_c0~~gnl/TRDRNA2_/TRDRNA2_48802_c0_seq1.p1  ORF type:complete len:244 (-),score=12.98 gnl/TRDRNA2_/TRDRNA2_48802_c0_seq1:37-768(-)